MKPFLYYERLVDLMEEFYKFMLIIRDRTDYLKSRYGERKEAMPELATTLAVVTMSQEVSQGET